MPGLVLNRMHRALARLNLSQTLFHNCTCSPQEAYWIQSGGVLNCSPGPNAIDQCRFESCNARGPGSIIYVSARYDTEVKQENELTLTNTNISSCWVGGNQLTGTEVSGRYNYTIVARFLVEFEFRNVKIDWSLDQQQTVHSSGLLRFSFLDREVAEVSIDDCEFSNTVLPEGMLSLLWPVKSFTYNNLVLRNVAMGNQTFKAGLTPSNQPIEDVHIINCYFEGCSTKRGFIDTSYIVDLHGLELKNTRFSECKCNNAAFLDIDKITELSMTSCHFGNVRWDESQSGHLLLLLVQEVNNTNITFIDFDLPKISLSEVGLAFWQGNFYINNCVFVVTCDEPNCTILLGDSPMARFECCAFAVSSRKSSGIVAPLLQFEGTDATHELQFYNCCFFKKEIEVYDMNHTAIYLELNGTSKVTFESTCFDLNKTYSVSFSDEIEGNATYDREDLMWGNCKCEIFGPLPTEEIESLVPEDTIHFSPTAPLNWITGEGQQGPGGRPVDPGLIAGIVVGLLLLLLLLILLILLFLWCRRKKSSSESEKESEDEETLSEQALPPVPLVTEPPLWAKEVTDNTVYAENFEEEEMPPLTCPANAYMHHKQVCPTHLSIDEFSRTVA